MDVVVVESPAKAKTINRYLGENYKVLASYGHVRDLPAKDGSVVPEANFSMDWEVDPKARRHLNEITAAVRAARHLYLATDPDREGEAISWHVCEVLAENKALNGVEVKRVVFNEITRDAILNAFNRPRSLDQELVEAYLARRALDYLVGFTLSPVLWRKLPGSRSAGRVQSVALRLICEREAEIENFRTQEYWTVKAAFKGASEQTVSAQLTHLEGRRLDKLALANQEAADAAVRAVETRSFAVASVERKQVRRQPPPPFITSTLQQEASRKLNFAASRTMKVAQQLYEGVAIDGETVGLITYMRTDGVQMAKEAVAACRALIADDFGDAYLPNAPRLYKTKAKNAQEAHEAVRPTDVRRRPANLSRFLNEDQRRLYTLIWKRTLASQMEAALLDQVGVDIASTDGQVTLRATGSVVAFDGFYRLYREGRDDPERESAGEEGEDRLLPDLRTGEALQQLGVTAEQHFTQPPPRFTEASLVKRLEELGIGRPSTYASILAVLQERKYVRLDSRRFVPEDRGRLVTAFLETFFERYVAYTFTADMEEKLDDISGGRVDWKTVLGEFWREFSAAIQNTRELKIKDVLEALDRLLGPHFFPVPADGSDPRTCPGCKQGRLSLKLGRFGAFIGCSAYPDCRHTRPLVPQSADDAAPAAGGGNGRLLGKAPDSDLGVWLRNGPYGPYLQLGEAANGGKRGTKPKRVSLLASMDPETIDLDKALTLLSLPRQIGIHPETREPITAGIGRYGPYIAMGDTYVSLKADDDVLAIGLNRAVDLLASSSKGKSTGRTLGAHPDDGKPVVVKSGRFGPYVQHGSLRATLPKDVAADEIGLEKALEVLVARAGTGGKPVKRGRAKPKARSPTARKQPTRNKA
jgi:DNA topoisomerase-1